MEERFNKHFCNETCIIFHFYLWLCCRNSTSLSKSHLTLVSMFWTQGWGRGRAEARFPVIVSMGKKIPYVCVQLPQTSYGQVLIQLYFLSLVSKDFALQCVCAQTLTWLASKWHCCVFNRQKYELGRDLRRKKKVEACSFVLFLGGIFHQLQDLLILWFKKDLQNRTVKAGIFQYINFTTYV